MHILADVGATKMRIAVTRDKKTLENITIIDTPQKYEIGLAEFLRIAREIAGGEKVEGVIAGMPGVLSAGRKALFSALNLPDWVDHKFADEISAHIGASVHLENDTALVGLGEAHFGAGKGSSILAYVTVSTGVNGVRIVDGEIDRSTFGFELGDQLVAHEGGSAKLSELISGAHIEKKYGMKPYELGKDTPVWSELSHVLAEALNNLVDYWSPDTIVLGGSMFNEIGISVEETRDLLTPMLSRFPQPPAMLHAGLGNEGGLYGGLSYVQKHF